MFLDYFALAVLLVGLVLVFYTFIYIHDLPYTIAKQRHHPHEEAIHVACWLSLFTLHAIWPLVFIWAVSYKKPLGESAGESESEFNARLTKLEHRLNMLEGAASKDPSQQEYIA